MDTQNLFGFLKDLATNSSLTRYNENKPNSEQFAHLHTVFDMAPCVIYLMDNVNFNCLYINYEIKNLIGVNPNEILHSNLHRWSNLLHTTDKQKLEGTLYTRFSVKLKEFSTQQLENIQISKNYRLQHKNGNYVHCLDQSVIVDVDLTNGSLITLGVITDITPYKTDDNIVLSIAEYDTSMHLIDTHIFKETTLISEREKEILNLLTLGDSSKIIADKLKISVNTVNVHRQNLLKKFDCSTSQELIRNYVKQR